MKVLFALCLFLSICHESFSQKRMLKTPGGAKYEIISSHKGKQIELDNVITVNFKMLTQDGKVLYSSYDTGDLYRLQVHASEELIDLMEVFVNLHDKDSAIVHIPADSIYKDTEAARPYYLPNGSELIFLVKIEKVQTLEEVLAEEKVAFDKEREQLRKYLKDHNLEPQVTQSGLLYVVSNVGSGPKPVTGDTVSINYIASSIDGKVFDTNIQAEAQKAGLKHSQSHYVPLSSIVGESGVITPWDEAIMMLNEGAKAKFIIPSFLAFGARGLGKIVKPYTTFVIEVEVVKVRKVLMKNYTQKNDQGEKKSPGKTLELNYLPKALVNNLSSFLVLMSDPNAKSRINLSTKGSEKLWYMMWWDTITRLLN